MKGKRKRLTNSQSELVATYLPKKIQKDRKIPTSVKLVLANIYQLHYLQKNWGKRIVFRERDEFIKDIEANDKNEVVRPQAYLMANDMVYIKSGVRGRATEYTLNDELYELLPSMFKGELSNNFMKFKEDNQLNIKQLETENQEVIVPSHNSVIDSELQHLNVPSDSDTDTEPETDIKNMMEYTCTGENNAKNQHNMKIDERLITDDEKDAWEILDISDNFDYSQHEDISEMVQTDAGNIGMLENPTYFEKKKNNEYVSKMFKKLKYYIREYKNSTSVEMANDWGYKVNDVYGSLDRSKFTESQLVTISNMIDEFDTLFEHKEKYLSKKYHKHTGSNITKKTVSSENSIISDGLSESEHCPSPAPSIEREDNMMIMRATMSDDEIAQLSKKSTKQEEKRYGKYDSIEECFKAFDKKWGLTTQEPMADYGNNSIQ